MEENTNGASALKKAEKRLERVKNFYRHLIVYIVINIILIGVFATLYNQFGWHAIDDQNFQFWYLINIISTPVLWGAGVVIHGLVAFNSFKFSKKAITPNFLIKWEERQIQKYLDNQN
jgi:hypothetical protein